MKKTILILTLFTPLFIHAQTCDVKKDACCGVDCAQKDAKTGKFAAIMPGTAKQKLEDKKENTLKTLAEKYTKAAAKEKPALEKDLKKELTEEEDKKIAFAKENLKRQEEKIKALKENIDSLEKTKEKRVAAKLEELKKGNTEVLDEENALPLLPFDKKEKEPKKTEEVKTPKTDSKK